MLRQWNKSVKLAIENDQVAAQFVSTTVNVTEVRPYSSNEEGAFTYASLTKSIHDSLCGLGGKVPLPVRVVDVGVDDSFVYYDVIKLDARTIPIAELNQVAAVVLADTIGVALGDLIVRCSVQSAGKSALVCGIPTALLQTLEKGVAGTRFNLRRIEPAFFLFLNSVRSSVTQRDVLVVRLHRHFLMLGLLRSRQWEAFSAEPYFETGWERLQTRCEAFCKRSCIPGADQFPVMFSASVGEDPEYTRENWNSIPSSVNPLQAKR